MPKDLLEGILAPPPSQGNSQPQQPRDLLADVGVAPAQAPPTQATPEAAQSLWSLIGGDETGAMQDPEAALQATRGAGKLGMGAVVGVEKPFAGVVQTALEGLAKLGAVDPQTRDAFTRMQMDFQNKTGKKDALKDAGEVFGEGLAYLLPQTAALKFPALIAKTAGPLAKILEFGTAAGTAAAQGATEFHEPGDDRSRAGDAAWAAALSAAGQGAVIPIKRIGTKAMNTAVMQDLIKDIKGLASSFDANARSVVDSVSKTFAGRQSALIRAQARQDLVGDAFHAGGVDTSSIVAALEKAKEGAPKGATGVLNEALKLLRNPPIKAGGAVVPPGSPLYTSIMSKGSAAGAAKYSTVRRALDTLDTKIDSASPELAASLKEPRKALADYFDDLTKKGGADLVRAAKESASREANLETTQNPQFRKLLKGIQQGKSAGELNNQILKMATGSDAEGADRLFKNLTPEGRKQLQKGIAFKALNDSLSEGGSLDPAKFAKFMENNPAVQRFFASPYDQRIVKGMKNLVSEASLAAGETSHGHGIGRGLIGWGTWDLVRAAMRGSGADAAYGAGKIVTGMGLLKFSNAFGKSLQRSQRAESFFAAAADAKPGSPQSIKLFNRFVTAFGSAAGAEAGGGEGLHGPLLELGAEKLLEPGMQALSQ